MIPSPLKWHGGKHYLAPRIVELMAAHTHYVEPYAGGLSVLLAKSPNGVSEAVNDVHKELTNFWRVLQDTRNSAKLQRILVFTPFSAEEWRLSVERQNYTAIIPNVERAANFFIMCRQSLAGRMTHFAPLSRTRTRRGMNEQASAWISAIDGLHEVYERLRRVVVLGPSDALTVIQSQDGPETLFYVDPPYLDETRTAPQVYAHEMTREQHEALLQCLGRIEGKFLLSGYRSRMYDLAAELRGWKRVDFDVPNNAAGGADKRRMTESVWMNY